MTYPLEYQISLATDANIARSRREFALAGRLFVRLGFLALTQNNIEGVKRYVREATYCYGQLGQTSPELLQLSHAITQH